MRRVIRSVIVAASAALLFPGLVDAHVRWFASDGGAHAGTRYAFDTTTLLLTIGAILFLAISVMIDRRGRERTAEPLVARLVPVTEGVAWRIIATLTGVMLLANAGASVYLATNLSLPSPAWIVFGRLAQAIVGVILIGQLSFGIAGLAVLVVAALSLLIVPFGLIIDYAVEFVALAVALILVGPGLCPVDRAIFERLGLDGDRHAALALPIIRIGTGLTLVVLAVHNKLWNPSLVLTFLDEVPLNFMPAIGFTGFTNLHFAFAAGMGELTLGLLLIAGIATRFVTSILAVFFVITLVIIGPIELVGHAPLFGIALLLILRGAGGWRLGDWGPVAG